MPKTDITFNEMEAAFFQSRMEELFRKAYEQGIRDAQQQHFSFPPVLTKDHLVEIFQVTKPTVNKLVAIPSFPKLQTIQARYPRDAVFAWIEANSTLLKGVI